MTTATSSTLLPVENYKDKIVEMVKKNTVSIIKAETGAGKSTQIPQYLLEAGYDVFVTVPSRTAAMTLATRVAAETSTELGTLVGYHTGFNSNFSDNTKILYSTEGIQIIEELKIKNEHKTSRVLIIDDVQEFYLNTDALIAWAHEKKAEWQNTKVILMSAFFDADALSKFFDNAPILRIPGKPFPIEDYNVPASNFVIEIAKLAQKGHNVLGFVPGRREIDQTIDELINMKIDADIFPMYADLPIEEQSRVFETSERTKIIISTNVAQASITIPDIDAVVDSGLERRMKLVDGISSLSVGYISDSDHIQRRGRAGRTKPGIYVWACDKKIEQLQRFPTPEIYTAGIAQLVLRLASIEIDANNIKFFHQPRKKQILDAQKTLRAIGAFDDTNRITAIGETMNLFPVDVRLSRMIVEGQKYGVAEDVATIAALLTFGGIKSSNVTYSKFTNEIHSDLLAELDTYKCIKKRINDSYSSYFWKNDSSSDPFDGITKRDYYRVSELRSKICDVLYRLYGDISNSGNRNNIIKSCVAGFVDLLYVQDKKGWYKNPNDEFSRKLNKKSAVTKAPFVVGIPKNVTYIDKETKESKTLYLLSLCTMVDTNILKEVAPQHFHEEVLDETFNPDTNSYNERHCTYFMDTLISDKTVEIDDFDKKRKILINWLIKNTVSTPAKDKFNNIELMKVLIANAKKLSSEEKTKDWYTTCIDKNFKNTMPNLKRNKNAIHTLLAFKKAENL